LNEGNAEELRQEYQESKRGERERVVNAQEWLDRNYPQEKRSEIKELDISLSILRQAKLLSENEKLEGSLDLSDFVNLEKLVCSKNRLSTLRLNGLKNLERISCNDNYLTSFDHSTLNPDKLTHLNISDNNLPAQDLSVFSQFIKLNAL